MGRRAKKAPVVTKKRPKLAKRFKCPFCANDDVVECKMDLKQGIGSLNCRLCGAAFQMPIHHLHEPIDVFSEWLDECEAAQNPSRQQHSGEEHGAVHRYQDDDEDDDEEDDTPAPSGFSRPKGASNPANQRSIDLEASSDEDDDD